MKKRILALCLLSLSLSIFCVYHKIGEYQTEEWTYKLVIVDDIGYVAGGGVFFTLDVSDPENPQVLGEYSEVSHCRDVSIQGHYAFLPNVYRLVVVDIEDPCNIEYVGEYEAMYTVDEVEVAGDFAYILTTGGISILDISDVGNIQLRGSCDFFGVRSSYTLDGDLIFVTMWSDEVYVYDVSDPDDPYRVRTLYSPGTALYAVCEDSVVYIGAEDFGVRMVDISDLLNPHEVGTIYRLEYPRCIEVADDVVYVGDQYTGLYAYDVSDPQDPQEIDRYLGRNYITSIVAQQDVVFTDATYFGLDVIDVSEPGNPYLVGHYESDIGCWNFDIVNDWAYIARGIYGFEIVDISNPMSPQQMFTDDDDLHSANAISISDNLMYILNPYQGFKIYDISDLDHIVHLSTIIRESTTDMIIRDTLAYVSSYDTGVDVIDMSDPDNARVLDTYFAPRTPHKLALSDDVLLIADGIFGLKIVSVEEPENMLPLCSFTAIGSFNSVEVNGDVAYVAVGDSLLILDISIPEMPIVVSYIKPHEGCQIDYCVIQDGLLFVNDSNWNELFIYDIENPYQPALLLDFPWGYNTKHIQVVGDILYTANEHGGINMLDLQLMGVETDQLDVSPEYNTVLSNYPNPFNPSTTIAFTIPTDGCVTLEVFNIKGQKVKSLLDRRMEKGEHAITWHGDDDSGKSCSSGVYLYRMKAGDATKTSRMLLMK